MNRKTFLLGLSLMMGALFTACKKDDINYESSFEKSYRTWLDFKSKSNNNYLYVINGSTWVGGTWQTTLTIQNGEITKRHFKYTNTNGLNPNIPQDQLEWTEIGTELNSHPNSAAASALTLDEVYDRAKNIWLKKRKGVETYFETKNNGLISSCGFVEEGCQDDCFNGISISKIERLGNQ